jgi:hypothetical protein
MRFSPGCAALALAALLAAPVAGAQSTDGYHNLLVFPVAVDTASFTQRFTVHNPYSHTAGYRGQAIHFTYYPADGTSQSGPLDCNTTGLIGGRSYTFSRLKELCNGLPAGSQFGVLVMDSVITSDGSSLAFAGFSRVANPQGGGFNVEAYPAHTFTSATSIVDGVRRSASTASAPEFQTNCFIGNMGEFTKSASPVQTDVIVTAFDFQGYQVGSATSYSLAPGRFVRLLDVFAAVGAPAGDYYDARVEFSKVGAQSPGLITFCTVQDNTSFNADFRIGKQARWGTQGFGSMDQMRQRETRAASDLVLPGTEGPRAFSIAAGDSSNDHLLNFAHPDRVGCEIIDPATNARALPQYGLELRLLARRNGAWEMLAGGNGVTGFDNVFLGDRVEIGDGADAPYLLEVESSGQNTSVERPYTLHCKSGSGHGIGQLVRTGGPPLF